MEDYEFEIIQQFIGTWTKNGFKHDDQEDFWGKTLAMEIGNLSFSDFNEMSPDERELTREIIQLSNLIKSGNLTEKKLKYVKDQILRKYTLLQQAREEHEREIECNGSINDKAKLIFKRMKTPYYSDNPDQLSFDDGDVIVGQEVRHLVGQDGVQQHFEGIHHGVGVDRLAVGPAGFGTQLDLPHVFGNLHRQLGGDIADILIIEARFIHNGAVQRSAAVTDGRVQGGLHRVVTVQNGGIGAQIGAEHLFSAR